MVSNYPTIHDLPASDRPRERLLASGPSKLSLQELLAIIIEKGGRGGNALLVAQNLLSKFGNLQEIRQSELDELQQIKGIGPATACKLKALFEISHRTEQEALTPRNKIPDAKAVFNLLRNMIGGKKQEHFVVLSLNSRNFLLDINPVSKGTLTASLVHPREVFRQAITRCAASVILAHNHPSSVCSPSENDHLITKRLEKAGKILGIQIVDHVIVSNSDYYSFKDHGGLG